MNEDLFASTPGYYLNNKRQTAYELLSLALDSDNPERKLAVYRSLTEGEFPVGTVWVRPVAELEQKFTRLPDPEHQRYFSYSCEEGIAFHPTETKAKEAAEQYLHDEREQACEGWSEEVEEICWGEVKGRVVEVFRRPREESDTFVSSDCDEIVDYALLDVGVALNSNLDVFAENERGRRCAAS